MEIISNKASRSVYLWAIVLVLVSFFIRFEYRDTLKIDNPVMKDAYYYYTCAYNIAKYNIFSSEPVFNSDQIPKPDSFLAPGFPYLLSSAIKLSVLTQMDFINIALIYNAVLGALIAPMVFYICIQFIPLSLAIVTSLITIFSPHLISIGGYLLTETLFCFLLMSSIVCFMVGFKNKSLFFYSLSSFLMGLSYLTNPVIFFLPFILACFIPFVKISELDTISLKLILRFSVVYLIIFLIVTGCWEFRNYISVDKQAKSSMGRAVINLMNGLYPDYLDTFRKEQTRDPNYSMNKDIERANSSLKKSIIIISEKIFEEPCKYLKWYLIEKPFIFWSWDIHIGTGDIYVYPVRQSLFIISSLWRSIKLIFQQLNSIFIFINFVGLLLISARSGRRGIYELLCGIILFYTTAIYSIFYPDPRYSIPFRPFFYIFFIWTLHIIIKKTKCFFGHRNVW